METHWIHVLFLMLGAFLIGYFMARMFYKSDTKQTLVKQPNPTLKVQSVAKPDPVVKKKEQKKTEKKKSVKATKAKTNKKTAEEKEEEVLKVATEKTQTAVERTDLSDFETPGQIRAIATRTRDGAMISNNINSVADTSKSLDFERLGSGNSARPDDLKKIIGIGPFIEERLNGIGIHSYSQIKAMNPEDIEITTSLIEFFPGRIERDNWVQQAADLDG